MHYNVVVSWCTQNALTACRPIRNQMNFRDDYKLNKSETKFAYTGSTITFSKYSKVHSRCLIQGGKARVTAPSTHSRFRKKLSRRLFDDFVLCTAEGTKFVMFHVNSWKSAVKCAIWCLSSRGQVFTQYLASVGHGKLRVDEVNHWKYLLLWAFDLCTLEIWFVCFRCSRV